MFRSSVSRSKNDSQSFPGHKKFTSNAIKQLADQQIKVSFLADLYSNCCLMPLIIIFIPKLVAGTGQRFE